MKAFVLGIALMVGITAVATVVLDRMDYSAQKIYVPSGSNVNFPTGN